MVLRKIDVKSWDSAVAKQFGIKSLPHVILYSPGGSKILDGYQKPWEALIGPGMEVDRARGLIGSDPGAAFKALEEIAAKYPRTAAADAARRLQAELADRPELAEHREKLAADQAARLLEEARAALEAGNDGDGYALLKRIVDGFGQAPAAAEARTLAEAIEADPEKIRAIRDAEAGDDARRALMMASNYAANGLTEKALAMLGKIVEDYPGSSWAEKAAAEIERIEKEAEEKDEDEDDGG